MRAVPTLHRALVVLWIGAGVVACGGPGSDADTTADQPEPVEHTEPGVYELGPDHYEVVVFAFEGGFEPSEIRVPAGARVDFRVHSVDIPHGFLIEGTDVELEVDELGFSEATHTFAEPGEHDFMCYIYCSGGHVNMNGTIIVE